MLGPRLANLLANITPELLAFWIAAGAVLILVLLIQVRRLHPPGSAIATHTTGQARQILQVLRAPATRRRRQYILIVPLPLIYATMCYINLFFPRVSELTQAAVRFVEALALQAFLELLLEMAGGPRYAEECDAAPPPPPARPWAHARASGILKPSPRLRTWRWRPSAA